MKLHSCSTEGAMEPGCAAAALSASIALLFWPITLLEVLMCLLATRHGMHHCPEKGPWGAQSAQAGGHRCAVSTCSSGPQPANTEHTHTSNPTPVRSASSSSGHFSVGPQSPPPLHAALQQQRALLMQPHAFSLQQEDTALYRNPLVSQPAAAAARESNDMGGRLRLQQHLQADNPLLRGLPFLALQLWWLACLAWRACPHVVPSTQT